jgi:uncharacterized protein involved in exopolysaccharide biosynthesis
MNTILAMDKSTGPGFMADVSAKLWRRKLFIGVSTMIVFSILAVGVQFLPQTYEASSSVSVEPTPIAVATGNVTPDIPFDDETIGTELDFPQFRLRGIESGRLDLASWWEFR